MLLPAHRCHVGREWGRRRNSERQVIAPQRLEPSQVQCIHCRLLWQKPCQREGMGKCIKGAHMVKRSGTTEHGKGPLAATSPFISLQRFLVSLLTTVFTNLPPQPFPLYFQLEVCLLSVKKSKHLRGGGADAPCPPQSPCFIAHPSFPPHLRKYASSFTKLTLPHRVLILRPWTPRTPPPIIHLPSLAL